LLGLPTPTSEEALQTISAITGAENPAVMLATGLLVLARMIGFMMVAPFFGSMNVPMTARVGLAVVLTAVVAPLVGPTAAPALYLSGGGGIDMILLLVNQLLVGLMLGFVAAFVFYGIESAGRVIDTQRGSNITDIIAPQTGDRTSPTGQWLMMLALVLLLATGGHLVMFDALIDSFRIFPATLDLSWITDQKHGENVIMRFAELSGESLMITLKVAGPAMVSLLLADVLLGIINRGAPQVNVFALSQVVKGPIGVAGVLVSLMAIAMLMTGGGPVNGLFNDIGGSEKNPSSIRHLAKLMDD
jgi:flagellar biosynthesis protein FliR